MNAKSRLPRPARRRAGLLTAVILLAACEGGPSSGAGAVQVRDSAGVTIVENPAVTGNSGRFWTVGPAPSLDLGRVAGPEEYQLFRVRDALRSADGRLVVLNAGTQQIRLYTADGTYLDSWGGPGEGPGEFMDPSALAAWPGDSIAVWDRQTRRITLFGPDGALGRTFAIRGDAMALPDLSHVREDGNLVVTAQRFADEPVTGLRRDPLAVSVVGPTGELVSELSEVPGEEFFMTVGDGSISILRVAFARRSLVGGFGDRVVIADNARFELRFLDGAGTLLRIVRVAEPPVVVTDAMRRAELDRRLANTPVDRHAGVRVMFEDFPMPDTLPALAEWSSDALGHLWVRMYQPQADPGPDRWVVLDREGTTLGSVQMPAGLEVYEIGADYVIAHATDDLDVEHVQVWPLDRGG